MAGRRRGIATTNARRWGTGTDAMNHVVDKWLTRGSVSLRGQVRGARADLYSDLAPKMQRLACLLISGAITTHDLTCSRILVRHKALPRSVEASGSSCRALLLRSQEPTLPSKPISALKATSLVYTTSLPAGIHAESAVRSRNLRRPV